MKIVKKSNKKQFLYIAIPTILFIALGVYYIIKFIEHDITIHLAIVVFLLFFLHGIYKRRKVVSTYTDEGIFVENGGVLEKTVLWSDFPYAYFRTGMRGEILAVLSKRELQRKDLSVFAKRNPGSGDNLITIILYEHVSEDREIIQFIEQHYGISLLLAKRAGNS